MKLDFHSIAKKVSLEAVVGGLVTSFCGSAVKQGSAGKLEVALGIVRDVVSVRGDAYSMMPSQGLLLSPSVLLAN